MISSRQKVLGEVPWEATRPDSISPRSTHPPTQRFPVAAAAAKTPVFLLKVRTESVILPTHHIVLDFIMIICVNAIHHDKFIWKGIIPWHC
jgi:hypothetical protein